MHFHSQNLTDGRLPMWRHGRAWWGRLHAEWSVFHAPRLCVGFEKGGHVEDGSGFCFRLALLAFSLYLSFDCARLFGRPYREPRNRKLDMSWHDGSLWLELWTADDDWISDRPWHRNTVALHVKDWIIGRQRCEHTEGEPFDIVIPMPEGCYAAVATPEKRTWTRSRWPWPIVREGFDIRIPAGIPFQGKGENSWDCGEDGLYGTGGGPTIEDAIGGVVTSVLKSRRRYGNVSRLEGRKPVMAAV